MIRSRKKNKETISADKQQRIDAITRKVAIAVAFIGVFVFFIKLLFF